MWDEGQLDGDTGYTGIVRKGMRDEGQMDGGTGYRGIVRKGMRDEGRIFRWNWSIQERVWWISGRS